MTLLDPNVVPPNAFEQVVRRRHRPGYTVEPASIAWDAVAFTLHGSRDAVACVPRHALDNFFDDLDGGRLDDAIRSFLASPATGRVLEASDQAGRPGLFDELASPGAIVPAERVPGRGRLGGFGGHPVDARREKNRRGRPRGSRRILVAGGVAVAVVAASAVALASRSGDDNKANVAAVAATASTTTTAPAAVSERFLLRFTIVSVNAGPQVASRAMKVGDTRETPISMTCDAQRCDVESSGGFGFTLAKELTGSGDHFEGTSEFVRGPSACPNLDLEVTTTVLDIQRDAGGAITGITGENSVVHPGGVEETVGNTTCSVFDVSSTFVGAPP